MVEPISAESYATQICYKIHNAKLLKYPYSHAEISDILPNNILTKSLEYFPDSSLILHLL